MTRNRVDHSMPLRRDLFLNEEDWQRAQREGGTFDLHGGFRVSVGLPMAVRIIDSDFDTVDLKWSVSFEPVEDGVS